MKLKHTLVLLFASVLSLGLFSLFSNANNTKIATEVAADSQRTYITGRSGEVMYVTGSGFSGTTNLAVYFWNSNGSAWSTKVNYRLGNGAYMVPIPYLNGNSTTWTKFIITRYYADKDPATNGWDGVERQSADISISEFQVHGHNAIQVISDDMKYQLYYFEHYGPKSGNHLYLDLTELPDWASSDAKLAIYFAFPNHLSGSEWSKRYSDDHTYLEPAFCHKVNGQDNDLLYECIVPQIYGVDTLWGMVIGVRINPEATSPNWEQCWNQTQDLVFNKDNHNSNIIRVTKNGEDWSGGGYLLDSEYSISNQTRAEFYGQYFLDTVTCSGDGDSDATTAEMWTAVEKEYKRHLSTNVEGIIWLATIEETDLVSQAMARYDYIVFYKQYSHNDFINRGAENSGKGYHAPFDASTVTSNQMTILLIVLGSLSAAGIMSIIVIKKKSNRLGEK